MNWKSKGICTNLIFSFIIFLIILFAKSIPKAIVLSSCFFILTTFLLLKFKDYLKSVAYLLGFFLSMKIVLYYSVKDSGMILYPGASVGIVITLYDILMLMLIFYTIVKSLKAKEDEKIKVGIYLVLPIAYLVLHILASRFSIDKEASICEIIRLIKNIIFSIAIIKIFNLDTFEAFAKGIAHTMTFQLMLGILQIIKGSSVGLSFLGESSDGFRVGVEGLEKGMSGTLGHPGTLGIFSIFSLCIIMGCTKLKHKKIYVSVCILSVMLTFARTSILLMFAIFLGYYILKIYRKEIDFRLTHKKIIIGTLIMLITIISVIIAKNQLITITSRFVESDFSQQIINRNAHKEVALYVYKNRTNWAYGPNNYVLSVGKMFPAKFNKNEFYYRYPVHNLYMLYLVELGILGPILYCLLYFGNIIRMLRKINENKKNYVVILIVMAIWATCMMIYNFTGWSGDKDILITIMWISIGISLATFKRLNKIEECKKINDV